MSDGVEKTSISLDVELAAKARVRAAKLGFKHSFSAYLAKLISDDLGDDCPAPVTKKRQASQSEPPERMVEKIRKPRASSPPKK